MIKEKLSASQQIRYGSIISYILITINILLGLLYTPWILKTIGSSDYGLYTLAGSLIALFLLDFGMSSAVTRFVAIYRAENKKEKINQFTGMVVRLYFFLMIIISAVLFIAFINIDSIYANLTAEEIDKFKIVFGLTAVCVVLCFPVNICNGILNAYEEYVPLKLTDVFNKIGTVLVTIIILLNNGGLYALILVNEGFNILTFVIKFIAIKQTTDINIDIKYFNWREMSGIFSFSAWTTVTAISQQMIFGLMPSILAMVLNTTAITLFGFANMIEGYVSTITSGINGMFLPMISRVTADRKDAKEVLPLMTKVGRINQSVAAVLLIGILVLGQEFVHVWVGDGYGDLYYCMVLLASPYLVSASQQIASSSIIVMNKIKYTAVINLVTGVMNLVLAYLLAPKTGIIGVCASIALVYWIRIVLSNIVFRCILNIDIMDFFKECHLKLFPAVLASTLLAAAISWAFPWNIQMLGGWVQFAIKVVLVLCVYVLCMWFLGWNRYEKDLILSFVKR